jgi:hypothetical protein
MTSVAAEHLLVFQPPQRLEAVGADVLSPREALRVDHHDHGVRVGSVARTMVGSLAGSRLGIREQQP